MESLLLLIMLLIVSRLCVLGTDTWRMQRYMRSSLSHHEVSYIIILSWHYIPFFKSIYMISFYHYSNNMKFSSVQFSRVQLFVTPWTAAPQASLSITNSRSPPKPMFIESACYCWPQSPALWRYLVVLFHDYSQGKRLFLFTGLF